MAEQQQDVDTLKRRGRRRLVGAVALVLLAVIVLPMVFDPEPRPVAPPVSVRIPGEDEAPFKPRAIPSEPRAIPSEPKAIPSEPKAVPSSPKAVTPKAPEKKEVAKAEPAPAESKEQFVVPVGAFADANAVLAKLSSAKIPYYTESVQGNLIRVRAGPFPTKAAADKALERIKGLGLQPGAVTTKG